MVNILIYPKCSTCKKAISWLETHGVKANVRHIVEQNHYQKKKLNNYTYNQVNLLKSFLIRVE